MVGDIRHQNLRTEMGPAVYRPYLQDEHPPGLEIYVRTIQSPKTVEGAIRESIHQLDPTLVVDSLRTMEEEVDQSAADVIALALLSIGFSALAMMLAGIGLYGVLAYSTQQRTREIGVRLALGSPRTGSGGSGGPRDGPHRRHCRRHRAAFINRSGSPLLSLLYGVTSFDPFTLTVAVVLTAVMIVLAAALPARRAASIEPMQALRTE